MQNYEIWLLFISCGVANAIGQWIYGFLGDRENVNVKLLYAISTIICGVTVVVIPFLLKSFALMITDQVLFGVFLSANYVLNSIILVEILGVDRLTDAYGMLLLLQGFALVIGSPIAGKLNISFYSKENY
jgi:MFS family permease